MNKDNRAELRKAITHLEEAKSIIENIRDEEQGKFDNLNEGLQASEKGQQFETNVSNLEDAVSNIESSIDTVNETIDA